MPLKGSDFYLGAVWVVDPDTVGYALKVNSDGSINVNDTTPGGGGTSSVFGAPFPADGTAAGFIDASGNMAGGNLDASGNLKVSGSFSASEDTQEDTGSASSAAVIITQANTTNYPSVFFQIGGIGTSTVVAEVNNNGTWVVTDVFPVGSLTPVAQTSVTTNGVYGAQTGAKGFRLRVSAYDGISTITADALFRGFPISAPPPATVSVSQSGSWLVGLLAGTAIIGKVGIDQTTPGTTNGVVVNSSVLPTGAATAALQPSNSAIGSTTSGQTGNLAMGAVTTAAPSYTTGQTNPLSLTTAGALRVDASGSTQPVSGTVTANQGGAPWSSNVTQIAGNAIDTNSGNKSAGTQRVVIATDQPAFSTPVPVSGTVTATPKQSSTSAISTVAASASNVTLLAANAARVEYTVYNDSTANLYLVENSAAASLTAFTWKIPPGGGWDSTIWTGQVNGIWDSATGNARITERT